MVQHSQTADREPTEQSLLLGKSVNSDEQGTYVSIASVSPDEVANANGTPVKNPNIGDDEESQSQDYGEVEEEGVGRSHVARIISVLLIGSFPFPMKR